MIFSTASCLEHQDSTLKRICTWGTSTFK